MSANYHLLTKLTPMEFGKLLAEANDQKWQVPANEKYAHRQVAYLRIAPNLVHKIEPDTKFEWSPIIDRMPFTKMVMRRITLALGSSLDGMGAAYYSRMVAGDYVEDHIDTGEYYQRHFRVQITLMQSPDSAFIVGGERVRTQPGDCITFASSTKMHSIRVPSSERLVLLFDVRR